MCGVGSIIYGQNNPDIGKRSSDLLRRLEYRGYDSTGAVFLKSDGSVHLRKKVGSPTKVIQELELEKFEGVKFIGQVRWATYGAVTDTNAQPHEVKCHIHLTGAHNGNISNTDTLKEFLAEHQHEVKSDNDGEMLVHMIEHYYAQIVDEEQPESEQQKKLAMMKAIRRAHSKVEGSYAACITDPTMKGIFAIKAGSSLYAGKGNDTHGDFVVVSSDLTAVLEKTRFLIPLQEGEGLYFTHNDFVVFSLNQEGEHKPNLNRSRLNIADISLQSPYDYFMHQEIYAATENMDRMIKYYFSNAEEKEMFSVFEQNKDAGSYLVFEFLKLYDVFDKVELKRQLGVLFERDEFLRIYHEVKDRVKTEEIIKNKPRFFCDEALLLRELLEFGEEQYPKLFLLDQIVMWKKKRMILQYSAELIQIMKDTSQRGGRIFLIGAGTSYHAALTGGYFFNNIGDICVIPANPGMFRSIFLNSLVAGDVIIGVTQSGETKDLLDIYNDVRAKHQNCIKLITIVNNENSTIPQEKSDFYLPILCGPEIAVAATKSFTSQLAIFYFLALSAKMPAHEVREKMLNIKHVIDLTFKSVDEDVSEVALEFFMKSSIHILGTSLLGVSKEGALKIREVVLNHTEGYDSAEFKHGPNTILGKNTIFSLWEMEAMQEDMFNFFKEMNLWSKSLAADQQERWHHVIDLLKSAQFRNFGQLAEDDSKSDGAERKLIGKAYELYKQNVDIEKYFSNYPLIFICPPDERDKRITISQVHTHKIRGADVVLIAHDDKELEKAVGGRPANAEKYYNKFIKVPKFPDPNMFVFGASVVLQLLALRMSITKMNYLNRLHIENHGVHPDVPKNVSKSITVD